MLSKIFSFLGIDRRDDIKEAIDATIKLGDELDSERVYSRGEIQNEFERLLYSESVKGAYMTYRGTVLPNDMKRASEIATVSGNINCLIMKAAREIPEQDILEFSRLLASDPFIKKAASFSEAPNTRRDVAAQGVNRLVERCPQKDKDEQWFLFHSMGLLDALMEKQMNTYAVDFFGEAVSHLPDDEAVDRLRSSHLWQSLSKKPGFSEFVQDKYPRLARALDEGDSHPRFDHNA